MDLWQARRFRKLLNLIDKLPSHALYMDALVNDEEYAQMVLDQRKAEEKAGKKRPPSGPRWSEFGPEVQALATLIDLNRAQLEAQKTKPGKVEPYTRPRTAIHALQESAKLNRQIAIHDKLKAALLPHKAQEED